MKSFLMIGQSNMAGRGDPCDVEPINNQYCHMLRMGRWIEMSEPVNPDRAIIINGCGESGISLAAQFANEYANEYGADVGLIPAAFGGTSLSDWQPGGVLYDHAVAIAKIAQRSSEIVGILWHQGEYDANLMKNVEAYYEKFLFMINSLIHDLELDPRTPVIIGEVGYFIDKFAGFPLPFGKELNSEMQRIARDIPNVAIASADGLTPNSDNIHFNARSLRELGKRYFTKYQELSKNLSAKPNNV